MTAYDETQLTLEVPTEWRILLFLHNNMTGMRDDETGEVYEVSEKGHAYADAVKGLYIHHDLARFALEMMRIGEVYPNSSFG